MIGFRLAGGVVSAALCQLAGVAIAADVPRNLDDYVVVGTHAVELGAGSFIDGSVGVNETSGVLQFDREVFMTDGSAVVADQVSFVRGSSLFDLFTNGPVGDGIVIRGEGPTPFAPSIADLPPLPTFAPDTAPITVRDGTLVLPPGAYGDVVVGRGATLELSGGRYEFASLSALLLASVVVDTPSVINVAGDLTVAAFGNFGPATSSIGARQIKVNVGGASVRFLDTAHADMDLLAPNAQVVLSRSFRGEGRFIGHEIRGEVTLNLRRGASEDGGPPPSQFCTLTQEVYGAPQTSSNPLAALVPANPQILPVTVGAPGINSLAVADAPRLICLLPASGAPASLFLRLSGSPGDVLIDACGNPPILDFSPGGDGSSGGMGGGELVGEVIAAKLNVALSSLGVMPRGLARFRLPTRLCTTKCPRGRKINPNPMKFQTGAVGVADGLTTVAGLIALADQALSVPRCRFGTCAGTSVTAVFPPNPIRMSDIQNALDAVNECFKGCASLIPCGSTS